MSCSPPHLCSALDREYCVEEGHGKWTMAMMPLWAVTGASSGCEWAHDEITRAEGGGDMGIGISDGGCAGREGCSCEGTENGGWLVTMALCSL